MGRSETDILIAGGGIAGLSTALAMGRAGFGVTLVTPDPPVTEGAAAGSDLRSTAFLQPARTLFEDIGLWPHLAAEAQPLDILRVVDTTGWPPVVRDSRDFLARDLGQQSFGWNLLNWRVLGALTRALADCPQVTIRTGVGFAGMVTRDSTAIVRLSDGSSVRARLVIGADGRQSAVREAAGIGADITRTGQKALAFVVTHPRPHDNASTEVYNEGGPFTMVPLPDLDGQPASAIVWMNPGPRALELAQMDTAPFEEVMTQRSCAWLGPLRLRSERRIWPILFLRARALAAQRVALVAEAAHVVAPIGAQGLNTSLNDVIALRDLAVAAGDPGAPEVLSAYAARRSADIHARVSVIDLYNRITRSGLAPLQAMRLAGLKTVHGVAPLRLAVMRAGMGG